MVIAATFFIVGFVFWCWCLSYWDRPQSMVAFWYAVALEFLGFLTLAYWAVTFR